MCTRNSSIRMSPDSGYQGERTVMWVRGQMREQEEDLSELHVMRGHHITDNKTMGEGNTHMAIMERQRKSLDQSDGEMLPVKTYCACIV